MVSFLEYNPIFHPAIMQVFGKTLICRSLDLCSHFARTANLDCITPEGKHACVHCIGMYTLWIMACAYVEILCIVILNLTAIVYIVCVYMNKI